MALKKKPKLPDKKIVKEMLKPKPEVKKAQRFVSINNVAQYKKQGWKESPAKKGYNILGAKSYTSDLVLMEKA